MTKEMIINAINETNTETKKTSEILVDIKEIESAINDTILVKEKINQVNNSIYRELRNIIKSDPDASEKIIKIKEKYSLETDKYIEINNNLDLLYIEFQLLIANYRAAAYYEVLPEVINVFKKYTGKKLGPKTKEKINNELSEKTGYRIYIHTGSYTHDNYISISTELFKIKGVNYKTAEIEMYFKYNNDKNDFYNFTDKDGKIIEFNPDIFEKPYKLYYYTDIKAAASEIIKLKDELKAAENALNNAKNAYSSFIPGNFNK